MPKAIAFARAQDDPDLWADLLDYSMDKPRFIRGLLEQVQAGSQALNPVALVRRIPEGLEIEGLREGIQHIVKEHEIQWSISEGVARVLRSEVAGWQAKLRSGQRRGIKFEMDNDDDDDGITLNEKQRQQQQQQQLLNDTRGKCAHCRTSLSKSDDVPDAKGLVGFACGHAFHLPHLLDTLLATGTAGESETTSRRRNQDTLDWVGERVADERAPGAYRVGEKVTRARLLRNRIRGGCPVCMGATAKTTYV